LIFATSMCRASCNSCWDWGAQLTAYYLGKDTDEEYIKGKSLLKSLLLGTVTLSQSDVDFGQEYTELTSGDTYEGIIPSDVTKSPMRIAQVNVAGEALNSSMWTSVHSNMTEASWQRNQTLTIVMYKTMADRFAPEYSAPNAIAPGFRNAAVWLSASIEATPFPPSPAPFANPPGTKVVGRSKQYPVPQGLQEAIDDIVKPNLYQLGNSSYFSESDYLEKNWKQRYWGDEIASKLESVKIKWDPELLFSCRHCIGDGMTPKCGMRLVCHHEHLVWHLFFKADRGLR